MKKNNKKFVVLVFLVLAIFCQTSCISQIKNDLFNQKLFGHVISVTDSGFKAKDKFGKVEIGKVFYISTTMFNDKGNMTAQNNFHEDSNSNEKIIYEYDKDENKVVVNKYRADGTLSWKTTYKYDSKGNEIESKGYDTNGDLKLKASSKYKYDLHGNKVYSDYQNQIYTSDAIDYQNEIYTSQYDANNNRIESKRFIGKSLANKFVFKYDHKGNKIKHDIFNPDGSVFEKISFAYDDKHNIIEEKRYNKIGVLTKRTIYTYVYDEMGNWIGKITFENDKATYIDARNILYK